MSENTPIIQPNNLHTLANLALNNKRVIPGLNPTMVNPNKAPPAETNVWGIEKPLFGLGRPIDSVTQQYSHYFSRTIDGSPLQPTGNAKLGPGLTDIGGFSQYSRRPPAHHGTEGDRTAVEDLHKGGKHAYSMEPQAPSFRSFSPFVPRCNIEKQIGAAEGIIADDLIADENQSPAQVVAEIKQQLESLICAVMLTTPKPEEVLDSPVLQGADPIEVSHRIMTRMKILRDENKRLFKLANGASLAQMESTIARLEKENAALRRFAAEHGYK